MYDMSIGVYTIMDYLCTTWALETVNSYTTIVMC
jgi:hypothetical protein